MEKYNNLPINYIKSHAVTQKEADQYSNDIKLPSKYTSPYIKIKQILKESRSTKKTKPRL